MNGKIKILYILKDLKNNGISNVIYNYASSLDRDKYEITIVAGSPVYLKYKQKFEKLGIKVLEISNKTDLAIKYYTSLFKLIKEKRFDIVHINGNSSVLSIELLICLFSGIKIRIVHCHSCSTDNLIAHKMLKPILNILCTYGLACSKDAGNWLFYNKRYMVMPNAFETRKFMFDMEGRKEKRKELNISNNDFVIGHVGRINKLKNQEYLIDLFEMIMKDSNNKDIKLLLVGDGPDMENIKNRKEESEYKNNIILYGDTDKVEKIYSAMDIFAFPSIKEGLGIAVLEAQISGLPCIVSDSIPTEAKITDRYRRCSLNNKKEWVAEILDFKTCNKYINRKEVFDKYFENIMKFDINQNTKKLEYLYDNQMKKIKERKK